MKRVYYKTEERKTSYKSFMNWFNKLKNINFINRDTSDAIADRFEDVDNDDGYKRGSFLEKGDKVILIEKVRCLTGMPEGAEYEVEDIFYGDMTYNILLTSKEYLGEGWEDYFSEDELIKID